jgi:hypothetical protein
MNINRSLFMVMAILDCDITAGEFAKAPQIHARWFLVNVFYPLNSYEYLDRSAATESNHLQSDSS